MTGRAVLQGLSALSVLMIVEVGLFKDCDFHQRIEGLRPLIGIFEPSDKASRFPFERLEFRV